MIMDTLENMLAEAAGDSPPNSDFPVLESKTGSSKSAISTPCPSPGPLPMSGGTARQTASKQQPHQPPGKLIINNCFSIQLSNFYFLCHFSPIGVLTKT
jgi:hypothetical protein